MATYYIDNDFVTAEDPDGGPAPYYNSILITSQVSARVYKNEQLIGDGIYSNIAAGWTTPIDTEIIGTYRIEYFVTDARGATATVSRTIEITDGLLADETAYTNLLSQVTHGMYNLGYFQSLDPDGNWAAASFLGAWASSSNSTFPTSDYNAYDNSSNRLTFNGHGAVVFQKHDQYNYKIMRAVDILGYYKITGSAYAPSPGITPEGRIIGDGTQFTKEIGDYIRWTYNGVTYTKQIDYIVDDTGLNVTEPVHGTMGAFNNKVSNIYTTVYSESPGTDAKIADITIPDNNAPSIVPRLPIVINGSPYTRARNMNTIQSPEGFAWTMRYQNGKWSSTQGKWIDGEWVVDALFSIPGSTGSYTRFGRNVQISKDGSTIGIHAKNRTYIYKRSAVFSHLIYQRASSSSYPSAPPAGSAPIPSDGTDTGTWYASDPGGSGDLYACRGKSTNISAQYPTYTWSAPYKVTQPDFPHSGNIHTTVSEDYGWTLDTTLSGREYFGESLSFSSNGSIVVVGDPDYTTTNTGYVWIYEKSGGSWSPKGQRIDSPASRRTNSTGTALTYYTEDFGRKVDCDDSGTIVVTGSIEASGQTYAIGGGFTRSGLVTCHVFKNNDWTETSMGPSYVGGNPPLPFDFKKESHRETQVYGYNNDTISYYKYYSGTSSWINYHVQGGRSEYLYHQPKNTNEYWSFRHGFDVKITGDGETMYVVSNKSIKLPISKAWDNSKTYQKGELASIQISTNTWNVYRSLEDNNQSDPSSSSTWINMNVNGTSADYSRWVLGLNETNKEILYGSVLIYKKVATNPNWTIVDSARQIDSGFYWKYDSFMLAPNSLGYNGWDADKITSIAISDDASTVLIGGSGWQKYTVGENGGSPIGGYRPGGFAFLNNDGLEKIDVDNSNFTNFINSGPNIHPDILIQYTEPPLKLDPANGGACAAVRSLTPNNSFIIYIRHNSPRPNRYHYYAYYLGGSNGTAPSTTELTAQVDLDYQDEYQAIEVFKNNPTFEYFWVRVLTDYKTSEWTDTKSYDSSSQINSVPLRPFISPLDPPLEELQDTNQIKLTWRHRISDASFIPTRFLSTSNQTEEYIIYNDTNTYYATVAADYSKIKAEHIVNNTIFTTNYSAPDPDSPAAEITTFYVKSKNYWLTNNNATLIGTAYTYDFAESQAPGNPINVSINANTSFSVKLSLSLPYDGYTGGKPIRFDVYYSTSNSSTNANLLDSFNAEYNDSANIKPEGFFHEEWVEESVSGTFQSGSTYYFWVKAYNIFGTSNFVYAGSVTF